MSFLWFVIYLIFGTYLINLSLNFYDIPYTITEFNKWFLLIGGILIIIGGINSLRVGRHTKIRRKQQ